ncbi:head decoration protein [Pectinatus frisingensis]|uniref:head decoration protein n=1 Tax=Pectinatus frisingensis TaxID=865 RepID=UPI0018C47E6D|nr:head decoration protein [Pectinatus frisingensis]
MSIKETITGNTFDELIGGPQIALITKNVTIAKSGVKKRGTVLGKNTTSGEFNTVSPATTTDGTQIADCILARDVDATAAAVVATVYVSGVFNRNKLIVSESDTVAKHEDELRDKNIYLTKMI